jgi:hypothetical protein
MKEILDNEPTNDMEVWVALVAAYQALNSAKPQDRSETARRYAVTITEMEKVLAYFRMMVIEETIL